MAHPRVTRRRVLASLGATPVASALATATRDSPSARHDPSDPARAPQTELVLSALLRLELATSADATVGSASILGGEAVGALAGAVQPGSLEWIRDPVRDVLQLAIRFELQAGAGVRIHVADRATVVAPAAGCWAAAFATSPELTLVDGTPAACREAVYVGRMDASQLHAGQLRLAVHRVL